MGTASMTGVLMAAALISAWYPTVAQEKGKTAAAELTSASQAALNKLSGNKITKITPK
jgi:hypothetical protein